MQSGAAIKILLAVHHFPPRYTAGAEWEAFRTAVELQSRGHQVQVVCVEQITAGPNSGVSWHDDSYDGVAVRRLSFNLSAAPDPFKWEYDNPWIGRHLQTLIEEYRPDVFHLLGGYLISGRALRVARASGVATVVSLMDFWYLCRRISMLRSDGQISQVPINAGRCARCLGEERRRYRWPARFAPGLMDLYWRTQKAQAARVEERLNYLVETLNLADLVISRSRFLASMYAQAGVRQEQIVFLRQGRDFPPATSDGLTKMPARELRVGYLGQIAQHKGVHILIHAVSQLPNAAISVQIFGNERQNPAYVEMLRRQIGRDSRISLAGTFRGQEAMDSLFRGLDVVVVPSLWYENSPNVILEAFAYRTPVIASDLGGMAELVEHGVNGLVFEPGNAGDLARQLQHLVTDPGLVNRLSAGIRPVKALAQEIDELEQLYAQAITRQRTSPSPVRAI